jgi:hypothetical protein
MVQALVIRSRARTGVTLTARRKVDLDGDEVGGREVGWIMVAVNLVRVSYGDRQFTVPRNYANV